MKPLILLTSSVGEGQLLDVSAGHNAADNLSGIGHSVLSEICRSIETLFQVVPVLFDLAKFLGSSCLSSGPNAAGSILARATLHFVECCLFFKSGFIQYISCFMYFCQSRG